MGHEIRHDGIRPAASHVKAVQDWPLPATKSQACLFLGLAYYYRDHIKDYARLSAPWTAVTGKMDKEAERTPLTITPQMVESFKALKGRLTTFPVLGFSHFRGAKAGKFILDTDFSIDQTAGILSQLQGGREVVIAYGSKKLEKCQKNYPLSLIHI